MSATEAPPAPHPDVTVGPEERPETSFTAASVRVGWGTFTSVAGLIGMLVALAGVLLVGAAIPQHEGARALLDRYDFSLATTLAELGFDHAGSAWPTATLTLLALVTVAGLVVRWRVLGDAVIRARLLWTGPGFTRVTRLVEGAPLDVARKAAPALRPWAPNQTYASEDAVVLQRGLLTEGLVVALVGGLAIAAGVITSSALALDARVSVIEGAKAPPADQQRVLVREGGTWLSHQLGIGLACQAADPADPWQRRACELRHRGETAAVELAAGRTVTALGLTLEPLSAQPLPSMRQPKLLLKRPEAPAPELLATRARSTYELPDGARISAVNGPDGPVAVLRPAKGDARLLVPAEAAVAAAAGALAVSGAPGWKLDVAIRADPSWPLTLAGVALLAIGLLLLVFVPACTVVIERVEGGGSRVIAASANRPAWPALASAAAADAASKAAPGEGIA